MQTTPVISATGPAAFGVIAERFRRAGQPEKAVALCREGLEQFPEHLSARVTLGWSLLDMGEYQEAFDQLKSVNKRAPDNLAAIRGLAELHERGIGLMFESMPDAPDADMALEMEMAPLAEMDPVMPAFEPAFAETAAPEMAAPLMATAAVVSEMEDLDPIFEPELALQDAPPSGVPHFEIEDVLEAGEADSMFDLAGLLDAPPASAPQPMIVRTALSTFGREPLALRDANADERGGELHEWLSRVRERRFNSVSQLMAG